jgi:hypothetical protein
LQTARIATMTVIAARIVIKPREAKSLDCERKVCYLSAPFDFVTGGWLKRVVMVFRVRNTSRLWGVVKKLRHAAHPPFGQHKFPGNVETSAIRVPFGPRVS